MADNEIKVVAKLEDNVSSSVQKMGANVTSAATGITNSFSGAISSAKNLVSGLIALAAVKSAVNILTDLAKAGEEAARSFYKLDAVNIATGQHLGYTTKQLTDMASAYQQATTFGDENIMGVQTQLAMYSQIGKEIFPQVMDAVVNVGSAFGDLDSAAKTLGQAMASPVDATRRLKQAGIFLTDQQEEQIKTFTDAGDILSAQKIILDEVTKRYGNVAAEMAKTPIGQLDQAREKISDIQEEIGKNLLPSTIMWNKSLAETLGFFNDIFFAKSKFDKQIADAPSIWNDEDIIRSQLLKSEIESLTGELAAWNKVVDSGTGDSRLLALISRESKSLAVKKVELDLLLKDIDTNYGKKPDTGGDSGAQKAAEEALKAAQMAAAKETARIKGLAGDDLDEVRQKAQDELKIFADEKEAAQKIIDEQIAAQIAANEYLNQIMHDAIASRGDDRATELDELEIWYANQLMLVDEHGAGKVELEEIYANKSYDINKKYLDKERDYRKQNEMIAVTGTANMFGALANIAAMGAKKNRELAIAAKVVAGVEAAINTFLAISKANASASYPYNIPAIAAATITGAAQVVGIASQQFAGGGIVKGAKSPIDSVSARLTGGEMVLNERQQSNLFTIANTRPQVSNSTPMNIDFSITVSGNADESTIRQIEATRQAQLLEFKSMYKELIYAGQI